MYDSMVVQGDAEKIEGKEELYGDDSDNDDEHESRAGHKSHRCTDILCLVIFFAALTGLGFVLHYCSKYGDWRRLYHGYDYLGRLCGVDVDPITNKTLGQYLYWCKDPTNPLSMNLDLKHPICLDSCPSGNGTFHNCSVFPPQVTGPFNIGPTGTFSQTYTYMFAPVADYASSVYAYRYCMPTDNGLMNQITQQLYNNWATRLTMKAGELMGAWLPMVVSGILALVLSFAYLFILYWCAWPLVILCLAIMVIAPLLAGGYLVYLGYNGGVDGLPSTGDSQWDKISGFTCLAIGLLFALLVCCARNAIRVAVAVIQTACKCMFSLPSLLLEPLINVIFKIIVLSIMMVGFLWLMSCGTIQKLTIQEYAVAQFPGSQLSGVFRSFSYQEEELWYMVYYGFMIFWVMELFTALGQFVVSYAVQLWYFTPYVNDVKEDVPSCPIFKGYCVGLFFHLGSLAFGAFIIAVMRMLRVLLRCCVQQTKDGNPALACCGKCCECCLWCFQSCIEFLNKNAYMDIAITSSNFCSAAKRALQVIASNAAGIAVLNGASWVICMAGLGAITAAGCYLTWLMLRNMSTFTSPTSQHYVTDPIVITVVAGLICVYIARSFMQVFDTVADCILYCYAIEKIRRDANKLNPSDQFAPQALHDLIQAEAGRKSGCCGRDDDSE